MPQTLPQTAWLVICCAPLLLLSACSGRQDISGEISLDLGGAQPARLALVDIQLVPEKPFVAHIRRQLPQAQDAAKALEQEIARTEAEGQKPAAMHGPISEAVKLRLAKLRRERQALDSGASPLYYTTEIDGAAQTLSSANDGSFTLSLERGKRYALVAVRGTFTWALWLQADLNAQHISLSEKNMVGSNCAACIFSTDRTPKTL
jgi:hypothetical protein